MDFRVLFEGRDELHEGSLRALTGAGESPADRRLAEVALVSSEPAFWEPFICALYYAEAAGIYDPARALDELAARIAQGEEPDMVLPAWGEWSSLAPSDFAGGIRALSLHFAGTALLNSATTVECLERCLRSEDFEACLRDC
jgi:hypothetical protein